MDEPLRPDIPSFVFVLPWRLEHIGGVNQVVINLAREMLRRSTFRPIVLVNDWEAASPIWGKFDEVDVVRWRVRGSLAPKSLKQGLIHAAWLPGFRRSFLQFCRLHRVAAVNCHFPGPAAFTLDGILRSASPAPPLMLSFHGADLTLIGEGTAYELSQWSRLLGRVQGVIACSHSLAERIKNTVRMDLAVQVIHNGIDVGQFVESAGVPAAHPPAATLLSVGSFEWKKGQDTLVRAFSLLRDEYPDLRLKLIGAPADELEPLKALRHQLGLDDRIDLLLNVAHQNIASHFRGATLFVLPSRLEPFGIVLLEAGCFSLPVVASNVGGISEIITHRETGLLVECDRPTELAEAIRCLLDNATLAKELGQRLHARISSSFTWNAAHDRYAGLVPGRARANSNK